MRQVSPALQEPSCFGRIREMRSKQTILLACFVAFFGLEADAAQLFARL